jgi:photosystem II stability/assembly factor-like uncharacterized protein
VTSQTEHEDVRRVYLRNAPDVPENEILDAVRKQMAAKRGSHRLPSASRRILVPSFAVLVAIGALSVGVLEAVDHLGKDGPILVITDDTAGSATTGQVTQATSIASPGGKWEALPLTWEGVNVKSLALDPVNPSILYAGSREGVFKSIDAAASWDRILSLGTGTYLVGMDPSSPLTIYVVWAATGQAPDYREPVKMMRSDDGGSSWKDLSGTNIIEAARQEFTKLGGSGIGPTVFDVTTSPATIYLGLGDSEETPEGITARTNYWSSADKGESWSKLDAVQQEQLQPLIDASLSPLRDLGGKNLLDADGRVVGWVGSAAISVDPGDPSVVYAGTDAGVCKSTDGGKTWTKASTGMTHSLTGQGDGGELILDPNSPSTLYAATREGVLRSNDGGGTWSMSLPAGYMFSGNRLCSLAMAPSATSTLYAWTSDGLFRTDDGGGAWTALAGEGLYPIGSKPESFNMSSQLTLVAADDPNTVFAVLDDDLLRSTDGGSTWTAVLPRIGASFDGYSIEADPSNPSVMYASAWTAGGSDVGYLYAVVKSVDKGATWSTIVPQKAASTFDIAMDPNNPATLYTIEYARPSVVSRSLDGGTSWEKVDFKGLGGPIRQLLFDPRSAKTLYALTETSASDVREVGVSRSIDGGVTWTNVFGDLPRGSLALAVDPASSGTLYAFGGSGIYKWVPED